MFVHVCGIYINIFACTIHVYIYIHVIRMRLCLCNLHLHVYVCDLHVRLHVSSHTFGSKQLNNHAHDVDRHNFSK